jgi:hypothetical protein
MKASEVLLGRQVGALWPRYEPITLTSEGEVTASSGGTLTDDTTTNTKGDWIELVASTAKQADGFIVNIQTGDTGVSDFLIDIGTGAAAAEVVLVSNILYSSGGSDAEPARAYFPIPIPPGTRVSARSQCVDLSQRVRVILTLCDGGVARSLKRRVATTYGADTSDSGGTAVDAGGSTHTKGGWAELSASVTKDFDQAVICVSNRNNATNTSQNVLLDLGVGAALSEVVIVPDLYYRISATVEDVMPKMTWVPLQVRAGQRLACRIQSSSNDATDRVIDVVVIGFS